VPSIKLTATSAKALKAPDPSGKPTFYWDTTIKGFGVLVSGKTASRSFIVQRDLGHGKSRRVTLGPVGLISFEDARKQATEQLLKMRSGVDPVAEDKALEAARKVDAKRAITLHQASAAFFKARPHLRPASIQSYRDGLSYLKNWGDKPLRDITREAVEARHKSIAKDIAERALAKGRTGTAAANGAMRALRAVWNVAAERIELPKCPVQLKKMWFNEPRRTSYIRAEDLAKFHAAVQALPNAVHRDYLTLLLFTGMRRSEAASLHWADIDFGNRTLRIPSERTKGKVDLRLPLSDVIYDMLAARRALGNLEFIFPSTSRSGHIEEPRFALEQVAAKCGVNVSAHDLRRTFITVAESCGIDGYTLKTLVGHAIGGDVTGGYVQMNPERLRTPVQAITDKLKLLCKA
jgi:integrase